MSTSKSVLTAIHQQLMAEPDYARFFQSNDPNLPEEQTVEGSRFADDLTAAARIRRAASERGNAAVAGLPLASIVELLREVLGRPGYTSQDVAESAQAREARLSRLADLEMQAGPRPRPN